jgi:hypothetical protein
MFITGVNEAGDKLFTGVNDTGDKFLTGEQLSLVTTTQAINLSPVTTAPVNNYRRRQRHRR